MTTLHSLRAIPIDDIHASDLWEEAQIVLGDDGYKPEAFQATASKPDGTPEAQALDVLYVPEVSRIGIAWGADAEWADMHKGDTVESMVTMFLTDHDAYEARR